MSATGDDTQVRAVPWWRPVVAALQGVLGAVTLVGGLTWLLLNLHGPQVVTDVLTGGVLAAGGLVLLMPHRVRLRPVTGVAAGAAALVGTVAGLAVGASQTAGMYVYAAARGYPFHWVQRGGIADDPDTARRLAETSDWQVDVPAVLTNVLFWAFVGLLVTVAVDGVRQARRSYGATRT
jgi:hypothetical protein